MFVTTAEKMAWNNGSGVPTAEGATLLAGTNIRLDRNYVSTYEDASPQPTAQTYEMWYNPNPEDCYYHLPNETNYYKADSTYRNDVIYCLATGSQLKEIIINSTSSSGSSVNKITLESNSTTNKIIVKIFENNTLISESPAIDMKTINGQSLLGSGNIEAGSSTITVDDVKLSAGTNIQLKTINGTYEDVSPQPTSALYSSWYDGNQTNAYYHLPNKTDYYKATSTYRDDVVYCLKTSDQKETIINSARYYRHNIVITMKAHREQIFINFISTASEPIVNFYYLYTFFANHNEKVIATGTYDINTSFVASHMYTSEDEWDSENGSEINIDGTEFYIDNEGLITGTFASYGFKEDEVETIEDSVSVII